MATSVSGASDWLIALTLADECNACPDGGCERCDWARKALERKGFGYLLVERAL